MNSDTHIGITAESNWPEPDQESVAGDENGALSIGDLAREYGVSLRALRFYQAKGLLAPARNGKVRRFSPMDRERLELILQGKRLCFTLMEVRDMLAGWRPGSRNLPIGRKQCVEQITLLERQRRDIEGALHELRQIYTGMFEFGAPDRFSPHEDAA